MKILITGHKGFVGSHLVNSFSDHDIDVFEWGNILPPINWFDWVIHVGAITSTTEKDVEKIMRQNVDFTIRLYESCKIYGVNFQFASSASVYGFNNEFKESSPVDPKTPYAWSKYLCERYILNNPGNIIAQIFRYFNVYGPNEEHKGSQASPFAQFAKQAKETGVVKVFKGSENFYRDFIHVNDIVNLHRKFLSVNESGLWNFGTGKTMSFLDVAKKFSDNIVEIDMPENLKDSYQKYTCADTSKCACSLKVKQATHNR
jgi:ADP-L-glycero-D-manno-heptose 6-epimerase